MSHNSVCFYYTANINIYLQIIYETEIGNQFADANKPYELPAEQRRHLLQSLGGALESRHDPTQRAQDIQARTLAALREYRLNPGRTAFTPL